jgi:hypothetical protein
MQGLFMPSNRQLSIAGVLAAVTAAVHTIAGTLEVHSPLLGSALPDALRLLLYACWHLVTVALCLSAWVLLRPPQSVSAEAAAVLARAIGILWMCFGLVFIAVALLLGRTPAALLMLPQWVLLLPVGWLAYRGAGEYLVERE